MINVCPVGRSCTQAERDQFFEYDKVIVSKSFNVLPMLCIDGFCRSTIFAKSSLQNAAKSSLTMASSFP